MVSFKGVRGTRENEIHPRQDECSFILVPTFLLSNISIFVTNYKNNQNTNEKEKKSQIKVEIKILPLN